MKKRNAFITMDVIGDFVVYKDEPKPTPVQIETPNKESFINRVITTLDFNNPAISDVEKYAVHPPNNNVMQATPLGDAGVVYTDRIRETFANIELQSLIIPIALLTAIILLKR